jgi:hypothetical protein
MSFDWACAHPMTHKEDTHETLSLILLKEYAQEEGVSAKLGVASELSIDLSCENRVTETAEYCEKVPRTSTGPHIDLVPGRNGTGTHLTHANT